VDATLSEAAARGLDRGLFTSSPGGVVGTAARVAQWRPLIVRAARGSGFSPNVLEALVLVESAGRPEVLAGSDVSSAAGLTQIVASTGRQFLRMHVNTDISRRLTRAIYRAALRGHFVRAHQLAVRRRHVDERFAPMKSLRATVRYLTKARGYLGRNDLAIVSYHMGIGNLQHVVADAEASPRPTLSSTSARRPTGTAPRGGGSRRSATCRATTTGRCSPRSV
jgi:soluble lytic murein transglycosylase-like protein